MTNNEMQVAAQKVANIIEGYKSNKIIMDFVTSEAREKVASEIRNKRGSGTTAKAVALLEMRHPNIKDRVQSYIDAGLLGAYMASLKA